MTGSHDVTSSQTDIWTEEGEGWERDRQPDMTSDIAETFVLKHELKLFFFCYKSKNVKKT